MDPAAPALETVLPDSADAGIRWMLDYWTDKRGSRQLPRRSDIDPVDFFKMLPLVYIVEGTGLEGLFVKLAGTAYRNLYGFEITGRRIVELIPSNSGMQALNDYRTCLDEERPVYREGEMTWRQRNAPVLYQRLLLPLADDSDRMRFMLGTANILSDRGYRIRFNF
jgi:hypothetical protein